MIDLTGRWSGSYAYGGSLSPVAFTADLRDDGGLVTGLIEEDGAGIGVSAMAHSTCAGRHDGAQLTFTKIYDSHDLLLAPIDYDGRILDEGHEISGTWTIRIDHLSGPFVMTRPRAATQSVEEAATVTV